MDQAYKQIIQEEVDTYAMHFCPIFQQDLDNQKADFQTHLEKTCQFDTHFFDEIFHKQDYNSEKICQFEISSIKKGKSDKQIDEEVAAYEATLKQTFKQDFMHAFIDYYISEIETCLEEVKEELRFAKEDEAYYEKRLYLEDGFGEEVTEEERSQCIAEQQALQVQLKGKISHYETVIADVRAGLAVTA